MNQHGYKGVRKRRDERGKPFYCQTTINGQRHATPGFTTAKEAFEAGKTLRRLLLKMRRFPPCTCTVPSQERNTHG